MRRGPELAGPVRKAHLSDPRAPETPARSGGETVRAQCSLGRAPSSGASAAHWKRVLVLSRRPRRPCRPHAQPAQPCRGFPLTPCSHTTASEPVPPFLISSLLTDRHGPIQTPPPLTLTSSSEDTAPHPASSLHQPHHAPDLTPALTFASLPPLSRPRTSASRSGPPHAARLTSPHRPPSPSPYPRPTPSHPPRVSPRFASHPPSASRDPITPLAA